MEALLFYIDDWLGSHHVEMMDAAEERGYFRLLLAAAKAEPDCGLPNDDNYLATVSKLGPQWFKITREPLKRTRSFASQSFKTSGQKLRECFFEKDGKLYNTRLLKCHDEFKERKQRRQLAAKKRWDKPETEKENPCNADAMQMQEGMQTACKPDAESMQPTPTPTPTPTPKERSKSTSSCPADAEQKKAAPPAVTLFALSEEKPSRRWFDEHHEVFYRDHYWLRQKEVKSRQAYEKRICALVKADKFTYEQASQFLNDEADKDRERFEFTEDWNWRQKLLPTTWLNQKLWQDQPSHGVRIREPTKAESRTIETWARLESDYDDHGRPRI